MVAPCLSFKFTGPRTKFLWVALPPLGLMSGLYHRRTQWVPLVKGPGTTFPVAPLPDDSPGWHQHPKTKTETGKKRNQPKSTEYRQWIQRRWEPVWASSPFTIQLSLSIKHADIPLSFAEAFSRTVFYSSQVSIKCSTYDFLKRVRYLYIKKTKVGSLYLFEWRW